MTPPQDQLADLGETENRRLLVVSNREPYSRSAEGGEPGWERTTGGLVSAIEPVVRERDGAWIAWEPGSDRAEPVSHRVPDEEPTFTMHQVPLTVAEVGRFYDGFANRALWPLCHYFIDRCHFAEEEWEEYRRVNERFADVVAEEAGEGDVAWIHDYHFCLLPRMLRERGLGSRRAPLAFFLHIPFPAQEIYQIFPWRRQILEGLLGADLVGFHTRSYAGHFLGCCNRNLGAEVDFGKGTVEWEGRTVRVGAFPIGIDVDEFQRLASDPETADRSRAIRERLGVEKLIFGVDRLDYSKGIPARLRAIDMLFRKHPEYRRKVTFVQVAVQSRTRVEEYQEIKKDIDELVGRINGRHGDAEWQPIHYRNEALPREDLVAHYMAADVGLVTPLRDGMNLVALEFCVCRPLDDGVLVLSEFAGAAERIGECATIVNPFAVHEVADALHEALEMTPDEQRRRMGSIRKRIPEFDQERWLQSILGSITDAIDGDAA